MSTLILTSPSMKLGINRAGFVLRSNGKQLAKIPFMKITKLIVHHDVEISKTALSSLCSMGIPSLFLDKEANVTARLNSCNRSDFRININLCRLYDSPEKALHLAKQWVHAKVNNSIALLINQRTNNNHPDIKGAIKTLKSQLSTILSADSIDQLRGLEGYAAKCYFSSFHAILKPQWIHFSNRTKRPPKDPFNALLSYLYSVITRETNMLLDIEGVDTTIGFLHEPIRNRPSLALDMVEPFRSPLADRLAFRIINLGMLSSEHFTKPSAYDGSIMLRPPAKEILFKQLENWFREVDMEDTFLNKRAPLTHIENDIKLFLACLKSDDIDSFKPFTINA